MAYFILHKFDLANCLYMTSWLVLYTERCKATVCTTFMNLLRPSVTLTVFYAALILEELGNARVQKNSRLHGSEPEETFTLYVVFEGGFEICIDNPVSAKFSYYTTSTMKGIAHLQLKLPRHTQCRVQKL